MGISDVYDGLFGVASFTPHPKIAKVKSKLGFHDYWQERSQAKLKTTFTKTFVFAERARGKNWQEHPQSLLLTDSITPVLKQLNPEDKLCCYELRIT